MGRRLVFAAGRLRSGHRLAEWLGRRREEGPLEALEAEPAKTVGPDFSNNDQAVLLVQGTRARLDKILACANVRRVNSFSAFACSASQSGSRSLAATLSINRISVVGSSFM